MTTPGPMTREELLRRIAKLRQHQSGGERAPHKPLLLLLALGRAARGESRLASYAHYWHERLGDLLRDFGPPRKSVNPHLPFWHLRSDGLWEIEGRVPRHGPAPSPGTLKKLGVTGGLPARVEDLLKREPDLLQIVAAQLLNANFPKSLHDTILQEVGLGLPTMAADEGTGYRARPGRDPGFREQVLIAYERRCAICDFDLRIGDRLLGLDAAHIWWHAEGGPDEVRNGLALCAEDHRALDQGAIGLEPHGGPGYTLLVSQELTGRSAAFLRLVDSRGEPIRPPQDGRDQPDPAFVAWHREQVFRGNPRPR